MKVAVYPGSFDPITLGHLNIIKRAAACFDRVIVCVMYNAAKGDSGLFTTDERVEMIRKVVCGIPNVEVDQSGGLLADYTRRRGAKVVVKGLRAVSDYEKEVQMALINGKLNPGLDTVFFPSSEKYTYLSSSVLKEIAGYGASLGEFVPREIIGDIEEKIKSRRNK